MRKLKSKNIRLVIFILTLMLTAFLFSIALAADQTFYLPIVFSGAPSEPTGVYIPHNSTTYVSSYAYLHVLGEIQNNSEDYLHEIYITVNFYTQDGAWLETRTASPFMDNLPPYTGTCFDILVPEPAGWSYYEFETPFYLTDGSPLANLTVSNDIGLYDPGDGGYEISGEVRNDQGSLIEYVTPVGTLYNAYNFVVGCDYTYVDRIHLYPNETSPFDIIFVGRDYYDVTSYRIQVEGDIQ